RSYGCSKLTWRKLSNVNQVIASTARRTSKRLQTPTRQTVQLSIASIGVNCVKSIARSCVEGKNRSNSKIDVGFAPLSETYEKSVNGWITCISPSSPNARLCQSSHLREFLKEA